MSHSRGRGGESVGELARRASSRWGGARGKASHEKGTTRALGILLVFVATMIVIAIRCDACGPAAVRVGTYNIRQFGDEPTDMDRLTAIVARADADVLAVQEIKDGDKLGVLARRLSQGRRRYAVALSNCGGRSKMRLGFVYDETRVTLREKKEYPELDPGGDGSCSIGERPGFAATFDDGKRTFHLLAVHFASGADRLEVRKKQWRNAHAIAKSLRASGPVAILGDANSTGYLDDKGKERTFIHDEATRAGLVVSTEKLRCSEYWQPSERRGDGAAALQPSLLDHVVASPGFVAGGSVEVHSFCRELACAPATTPPPDYQSVTDHCPVTFALGR